MAFNISNKLLDELSIGAPTQDLIIESFHPNGTKTDTPLDFRIEEERQQFFHFLAFIHSIYSTKR